MRARDIAMLLQIPKGKRSELFEVLDALEAEGKICSKKGKYEKVLQKEGKSRQEVLEGTFLSTARGFGFVEVEGQEDIYIHEEDALYAFHQDRVQVLVKPEQKGRKKKERLFRFWDTVFRKLWGLLKKVRTSVL